MLQSHSAMHVRLSEKSKQSIGIRVWEEGATRLQYLRFKRIDTFSGESRFIFDNRFLATHLLLRCDILKDLIALAEAAYEASVLEYEKQVAGWRVKVDAHSPEKPDDGKA